MKNLTIFPSCFLRNTTKVEKFLKQRIFQGCKKFFCHWNSTFILYICNATAKYGLETRQHWLSPVSPNIAHVVELTRS